jgi:pyruvate-formate lyase-activating enzyme
MSKHKFFPIKTATACSLKWNWSTIFLNDGTTASCHRVGRHPVSLDNFDNFHNTPEKIAQRETMLNGKWPQPLSYMNPDEGCRYCQKIEEANGQSDRMFHLQVPDLVPVELDKDPWTTKVTPTILEVFFSNTCNLACTYCFSHNSSQIERENIKFGTFEKNGVLLKDDAVDRELNADYTERLFVWLEKNSTSLRRLHLLGGEPLYIKDFYRCLDFFQEHPNPELEFNIVTNLMIAPEKFQKVLETFKTITIKRAVKRFDITVSLDCWGPEQEHARWGLKLETIKQNIELLLDKPWIYLNINSTLSPLTIKTFPDLVELINQWKKRRNINHHFQTVFSPLYHNPDIFGPEFWKDDLDRALSIMPQNNWQENNAYRYLAGIKSSIQTGCKNPELIVQLNTHLDELDRRRGTDWKKLFPYLDIEKHVV